MSARTARAVIKDLLDGWPLSEAQRRKLLEKLAQIEEALERARKLGLREARDKVEASAEKIRDGVRNQGARVAQMVAVRSRLTVRLDEITAIVPFSRYFQDAVRLRIKGIWARLDLVWRILHNAQSKVKRVRIESDLFRLMDFARQVRSALSAEVWPSPFEKVVGYLSDKLQIADKVLRDKALNSQSRAKKVAGLFAAMIARLQAARRQRELERVIWRLSIGLDQGTLDTANQRIVRREIWELRSGMGALNGTSGVTPRWVSMQQGLMAQAARLMSERKFPEAKEVLKRASERF